MKSSFYSIAANTLATALLCALPLTAQAKDYAVFTEVASNCLTTDLSAENSEKSVASGALALLLPAVVKPLISGVAALIENAGAEHEEWSRKHNSSQYFYTSQAKGDAPAFKLEISKNARCLTIIAGEINSEKVEYKLQDTPFFEDSTVLDHRGSVLTPADEQSPSLAKYLEDKYNFSNRPFAYLEFELRPISTIEDAPLEAIDGWTLTPKRAFVAPRISKAPNSATHKSKYALSLIIDFSKSGTGGAPESFAQWTYDLSKLQSGVSWSHNSGTPAPGELLRVPVLPPALDAAATEIVAEIRKLQKQFDAATTKAQAANTARDAQALSCDGYTGATSASKAKACDPVVAEMTALSIEMDPKVIAARNALEIAKAKNADNLKELETKLELARIEKTNAMHMEKLKALTTGKYNATLAKELAAANGGKLQAQYNDLNLRANRGLLFSNVTATVIASREARPVLQAIGKALQEKSDEFTKLIETAVIPGDDTSIADLETETTAKSDALTKIGDFETARLLATSATATVAQKLAAEAALLQAQASCTVLTLQGYTLDACSTLPVSFYPPEISDS